MFRLFLVVAIFSIYPPVFSAEENLNKVSKDWWVISNIDDFTDKKSCYVVSSTFLQGKPAIAFYTKKRIAIGFLNLKVNIAGIKYRVDKNPTVQLGSTSNEDDTYQIKFDEDDEILKDVKGVNTVIAELTPDNRFMDNKKIKLSLSGFSQTIKTSLNCK